MYELKNDQFYKIIQQYNRCVVEYCLMADDKAYQGIKSHKEAINFAMLTVNDRSIEDEIKFAAKYEKEIADKLVPWSSDIEKAKAVRIDTNTFLFVPKVLHKNRFGMSFYDCDWTNQHTGDTVPYWYAFLESPYAGTEYAPEDFLRVNHILFPKGTDTLEVYEWTTDWSDYFDDGHEWWGASCWSVYDQMLNRYVVILVSSTD